MDVTCYTMVDTDVPLSSRVHVLRRTRPFGMAVSRNVSIVVMTEWIRFPISSIVISNVT